MSGAPITLVGPGSEWFWSMAQFVVVAITLIGIYYQFRLQRAANAFEHGNRIKADWESEQRVRTRLGAARDVKAGKPPSLNALLEIGFFWESVGSLVRRRFVDARVVYEATGNAAFVWWAWLEPDISRARSDGGGSDFAQFEWLVRKFAEFAPRDATTREHGPLWDRAMLLPSIDEDIKALEQRLEILEDSRRVTVSDSRRSPRRAEDHLS